MNLQKRIGTLLLVLCVLLTTVGCAKKDEKPEIKNVILMISDGTSVGVSTLTRWCQSYDQATGTFDTDVRLNVDPLTSGLIRTYWQNAAGVPGAITDSAPGSTAFSTGYKTNDKYVGVGPDGTPHATVLELAESLGKSTGLAVTVNMQHATPADFAAHTTDRSEYENIASQMMESGVDVMLGGGAQYLQNRADGRDLIAELKTAGYDYLTTKQELADYQGEQVYGLFAEDFMAYDIDRALLAPEQPSLSEMTGKAIELLGKNDKGFFLMVEGSKVDWGAHNNDPVAVVSEFRAFDEAVKSAVDFAKGRDDTMVLIVEDHGTGGISIGSSLSDKNYSSYPLADIIAPLTGAQITGNGALELLAQGKSAEEVLALYGIDDPTAEELAWTKALKPDLGKSTSESRATFGQMLSSRSNIGWTTIGHTGEDVVLYSYLPGDERITGLLENIDVTKAICDAWGAELTDAACPHGADVLKKQIKPDASEASTTVTAKAAAEVNFVGKLLEQYQSILYRQEDFIGNNTMDNVFFTTENGAIESMAVSADYNNYCTDAFRYLLEDGEAYYTIMATPPRSYIGATRFVEPDGVFTKQTTNAEGDIVCTLELPIDADYADTLSAWNATTEDKMVTTTVLAPDNLHIRSMDYTILHKDGSSTRIASGAVTFDQPIVESEAAKLYAQSEKTPLTVIFEDQTSYTYEVPKGSKLSYFCEDGYALYKSAQGGEPYPQEILSTGEALTLCCLPKGA